MAFSVVHREHPLNCETSIPALISVVTPSAHFYVRNHFQVPALDARLPGGSTSPAWWNARSA